MRRLKRRQQKQCHLQAPTICCNHCCQRRWVTEHDVPSPRTSITNLLLPYPRLQKSRQSLRSTGMAATSNGAWQGDDPIHFSLPLLIVQICIVLILTRTIAFLLQPLRQPRVIAEIIGGIILGPSVLGRDKDFLGILFPESSLIVLDTVAGLGLLFFLFLVGLELDLQVVRRSGAKALSIAAAGISLPFLAGVGVCLELRQTIATGAKLAPFLVFMGVAMSITAFPVLARILAELRLLTTEEGQMAMSAAAVNDVVAWVLLALAVALSGGGTGTGNSPVVVGWVLLSATGFVIVMLVAVRPAMVWVVKQTEGNGAVHEMAVALSLAGVLAAGFCTDAIGIHSIFGAFLFGLILPKDGPFAGRMIEKIKDMVMTLFLPLYFVSSGLKTDIGAIHGAQAGGLLVLVVAAACGGKVLATVAVSLLHRVGFRKSLTLGFLMNTKGLVELIVLNIGKDRKVLNDQVFAIMVVMALFTTFITTPVVMMLSTARGGDDDGLSSTKGLEKAASPESGHVDEKVPCSVAVLVDGGLGGAAQTQSDHSVAVLFFGGPDDREALALATRMAEHPGVKLRVVRFVAKSAHADEQDELDEAALYSGRQKAAAAADGSVSVVYEEVALCDPAEAIVQVGESNEFDLIIVGRCRKPSRFIAGLASRSAEHSELGPVGDILTLSSGGHMRATIVVVQQSTKISDISSAS